MLSIKFFEKIVSEKYLSGILDTTLVWLKRVFYYLGIVLIEKVVYNALAFQEVNAISPKPSTPVRQFLPPFKTYKLLKIGSVKTGKNL